MAIRRVVTRLHSKFLLWIILAASLAGLAAALTSQYMFAMQPCPWCILQRLICVLIAIACAVGLVSDSALGHRFAAGTALLLALSGIAAALWQHFEAAKTDACMLTLADRILSVYTHLDRWLPSVFAVRASCAQAEVAVLGLPYEFWSLGLFAAMTVASARIVVAPRARVSSQ
jgi:disulfide bond formation protein DsbB